MKKKNSDIDKFLIVVLIIFIVSLFLIGDKLFVLQQAVSLPCSYYFDYPSYRIPDRCVNKGE